MSGTLLRPPGTGPFPAVVLVAGSGPTDRDWNSPLIPGTNGSGRLLAEALARAGFASLRYDKRVVGAHARENIEVLARHLTMRGHVDELASAVETLADQPGVDPARLFALGNSEGTLHALHYQLESPALPLAGLVLAAPPGRPVGAVARSQLAAQAAAVPDGEALLALYDAAVARFLAGRPADPDPALPEGVRQLVRSLEAPVNLPFARELWTADAAPLLGRVDVPVLVVIGQKDLQVDWRADGEPLQRAAAGRAVVGRAAAGRAAAGPAAAAPPDAGRATAGRAAAEPAAAEPPAISFLFPENANHVLKHELRARADLDMAQALAAYNAPDARLDPDALAGILDWLAAQA